MINPLKNIILLIVASLAMMGVVTGSLAAEQPIPTLQPIAPQNNAQRQKLYDYLLNERGIDVVKVGETRTIVIASDPLFIVDSANFNDKYAQNLKIVAGLINSYDTTSVEIAAYTDKSGDVARALTEKQAQKVMMYLKKNGVDTRLIYAKGYGNLYPVAISEKNKHFNRRIEIKFQFHKEESIY